MKPVLGGDDPGPPRRRPGELDRRFDGFGSGVREEDASDARRGPLEQLAREQRRKRPDAELHGAGRLELERLDEGAANGPVVPADVKHSEAAEHVEVASPLRIDDVRALRSNPAPVEADRPQETDELRIDCASMAVELLAGGLVDHLAEIEIGEGGAVSHRKVNPLRITLRDCVTRNRSDATLPRRNLHWQPGRLRSATGPARRREAGARGCGASTFAGRRHTREFG